MNHEPKKECFKTSVGGQALMEGIMMRGPEHICCAVRKPDGTIETKIEDTPKHGIWAKIPLVRGAISMIESLITGYHYMMYSAQVSMGDEYDAEEEESAFEKWVGDHLGKKAEDILMAGAALVGGLFAILLFTVLPTVLVGGLGKVVILTRWPRVILEAVLKVAIFLSYMVAISKMKEIHRVFEYHGAEHKTIACYEAGDELTEGSVNPHDILKIKGVRAVQDYMLREVQRVYRLQGVKINDKHFEVIVRQMMRKVEIDEPGDTRFLEQQVVDKLEFMEENDRIWGKKVVVDAGDSQNLQPGQIVTARKLRDENSMLKRRDLKPVSVRDAVPATSTQILQGITRAALQTSSFMSAASFQETTKVLNEAAINGKVDRLEGMKENVICGHLIPAGTGQREFEKIIVGSKEEYDRMLANKKTVLDYAVDDKVEE